MSFRSYELIFIQETTRRKYLLSDNTTWRKMCKKLSIPPLIPHTGVGHGSCNSKVQIASIIYDLESQTQTPDLVCVFMLSCDCFCFQRCCCCWKETAAVALSRRVRRRRLLLTQLPLSRDRETTSPVHHAGSVRSRSAHETLRQNKHFLELTP